MASWKGAGSVLALLALAAVLLISGPRAVPASIPGNYCVGLAQGYGPILGRGLVRHPEIISMRELDALESLSRNHAVAGLAYFNRLSRVRWHRDAAMIGRQIGEFEATYGRLDAVREVSRSPVLRTLRRDDRHDEIVLPLFAARSLQGILWLEVRRDECPAAP